MLPASSERGSSFKLRTSVSSGRGSAATFIGSIICQPHAGALAPLEDEPLVAALD